MLERIFASELKIKIINLLLAQNDNKALTAPEIAKSLSLRGSVWRRELDDLVEIGLIAKGEADKPSFLLDKNFFIYKEIKALFAKSRILLSKKIFQEIETQCRPKLILLSGKFVNKSDTKIDLLIVGNISRRIFNKLLAELEDLMGEEINYSLMTEEEFKYRRYVMDIFLYNVIEGENIILSGDLDNLSILNREDYEGK